MIRSCHKDDRSFSKVGNTVQYFDKFVRCDDNFEMIATEPHRSIPGHRARKIDTCDQSVCNIAPTNVTRVQIQKLDELSGHDALQCLYHSQVSPVTSESCRIPNTYMRCSNVDVSPSSTTPASTVADAVAIHPCVLVSVSITFEHVQPRYATHRCWACGSIISVSPLNVNSCDS